MDFGLYMYAKKRRYQHENLRTLDLPVIEPGSYRRSLGLASVWETSPYVIEDRRREKACFEPMAPLRS